MTLQRDITELDPESHSSKAMQDLVQGLLRSELWGRLGWLEIRRRYRRTILGPFWSSGTLAIYTLAVGIVGAGLFRQDVKQYLPYLSSGMIVWTLISTIITESGQLLVAGGPLFRNVRFEYSILAYALVWRNFVVFLHNLVIFFVIVLVLNPGLIGFTTLAAPLGIVLVLVNGVWIALLAGILCLRYRDVQPIILTIIQICTLVTPIFWTPTSLEGHRAFLFINLNPIYRLIEVVRAPLLGEMPTLGDYVSVGLITVVGWTVTFIMFGYFRRRISYWS